MPMTFPKSTGSGGGGTGPAGPEGASAYEVAVANGFVGTEAEWLTSLEGEDGVDGADGPAGAMGLIGPTGDTGPIGPSGPEGVAGPKGDTGDTGAQGVQGVAGDTGPQGIQGPAGLDGADGAQGPAGDTGPSGLTGPAGADGSTGPQGPQGIQGVTGAQGDQGPQGLAGPTGATGAKGDTGDAGADGAQGPQGIQGATGAAGADGASAYDVWIANGNSGTEADYLDQIDNSTIDFSPYAQLAGATFTGGVTATGFTGNGGGLTDVDAANLGGTAASGYALLAGANFGGYIGVNGATPDASNQFAFYGTNALFNSGSDIGFKFNKNSDANDASITYQSGFTTHALVGLLGNNDYTLKVGTGFTTALVADNASGRVYCPQGIEPQVVQLANTDVTTSVNTTAYTDVPLNGSETIRDTAVFERTGAGFRCLRAGKIKLTASVHVNTTVQRMSLRLQFAKNGTRFGPIGDSGYIRSASGHNDGSTHVTTWDVADVNDIYTVQGLQAGVAGTGTMAFVGTSIIIGEMW